MTDTDANMQIVIIAAALVSGGSLTSNHQETLGIERVISTLLSLRQINPRPPQS